MRCVKSLLLLCSFAFAVPLQAAETGMAFSGLRTVLALAFVIALMFGLAWAMKRYGPVARVRKSFGLDILGQVALGSKTHLALIRVDRSVLLLGVTQNSINLIKELDRGDFERSLSEITKTQGGHQ